MRSRVSFLKRTRQANYAPLHLARSTVEQGDRGMEVGGFAGQGAQLAHGVGMTARFAEAFDGPREATWSEPMMSAPGKRGGEPARAFMIERRSAVSRGASPRRGVSSQSGAAVMNRSPASRAARAGSAR